MVRKTSLLLGLIGDNIASSRAPLLHRIAGSQNGIKVQYDRLTPKDRGLPFDALFASCTPDGYRGINITYPYKEKAAKLARVDDPQVRAIGAINTVIFEPGGARGYNTDYSGFVAGYRAAFGDALPGNVALIGTGGVGRAVSFGLASLGVAQLRLVDCDRSKAEALSSALEIGNPDLKVSIWDTAEKAAIGANGLVNCTPVGMVGHDGTPMAPEAMIGADWAFDAIYTPLETQFLIDAKAAGLSILSGWELFIYQGIHAWKHFSGTPLDEIKLRQALTEHMAR